jgi:AcrR family transcriptional regulator
MAAAAIRSFEQKGFAATTIDEIAEAADYHPRSFFRQFESKEDVVFFDLSDFLRPIQDLLEGDLDSPAWAAVCALLIEDAENWGDDGHWLSISRTRLIFSEPVLRRRFLEIAADWQDVIGRVFAKERGTDYDTDTYAQLLAAATIGACLTAMRVWVTAGGRMVDHFQEGLDLIEDGFHLTKRPRH